VTRRLRDDLECVVYVPGFSGVMLRAGDEEPEGVTLGDHLFNEADQPQGYSGLKLPDLHAEIDKRNEGRADDDKIVIGGKGNKADLVSALEADDASVGE
jgi:hypothetical protein